MSLASRITDAIDALIVALNARTAPGPSDYQMWLAQGNTGTISDYRQAQIGPDEDYAAYLNGLLTTPPRAGAASEAQTGVTQLATAAEVAAGAVGTKAVSPLRLAAAIADLLSGGRLAATNKDVSGGDWNNQMTTGFFMGSTMANAPGGDNGWSHVVVQRYGDDYVTQIATSFTVNGNASPAGTTYVRQKRSGNWQAWLRLISTATTDSPIIDRGPLGATVNWNALVTPGVYLMNGGGGNPPGFPQNAYNYGHLVVLVSGQGATQMYFPDAAPVFYWRHGFGAAVTGFGTKAWSYHQPTGSTPPT